MGKPRHREENAEEVGPSIYELYSCKKRLYPVRAATYFFSTNMPHELSNHSDAVPQPLMKSNRSNVFPHGQPYTEIFRVHSRHDAWILCQITVWT